MRLISPGANPPSDVGKYLLPHEQEVITVRKHPAVLLAPVAWAVLGLIAAALLSTTLFRHSSTLTWIVWAAWGLVFLRLLWAAANWAVRPQRRDDADGEGDRHDFPPVLPRPHLGLRYVHP